MTLPAEWIGRRTAREGVIVPVTLFVESNGQKVPRPSFMVDLSVRGTKVKANVMLQPGVTVEVSPSKGRVFAVPAKIVWSKPPVFGQEVELGLEFFQPVPIRYWLAPSTRVP